MDSKRAPFVTLKYHTSAPVRKERFSSSNKVRREASQKSLWKKARCQTESKALKKLVVARIV